MIPLATSLRRLNASVTFGAGEKHLALFMKEMPEVPCINFPGFRPGYSRMLPQYLWMLIQTPLLLYHIIREHRRLNRIILDNDIDIVISDNRFGLWNKKVKTVYITHMPVIPLPGALRCLEFIGVILHRWIIRKYDLCFIPDLPGEINLSGRLSHDVRLPSNCRFIGLLSRFTDANSLSSGNPFSGSHNTVVLSGPEPQRGILKKRLTEALMEKDPPTLFLGGMPEKESVPEHLGKITIINHLPSSAMKEVLMTSKSIISRSGYTTIMELISLNCSALLIPTPGQTEQEYLARYLESKGWFRSLSQNEISAHMMLPFTEPAWTDDLLKESRSLLEKALKELLSK